MAKIIIDARIIGSGTGIYAENLIKNLATLDSNNKYIIITDPNAKWFTGEPNLPANFSTYSSKNTSVKNIFGLRGNVNLAYEIYKMKPDLVHFTIQQRPFFYLKKNYVITIHDLTEVKFKTSDSNNFKFKVLQFMLKNGIRISARRARLIITDTKFIAAELAKSFNLKKDKIIPIHLSGEPSKDLVLEKPKKLPNGEFMFYSGNAYSHKNISTLLHAMTIITKKYPKLNLITIGKIDDRYKKIIKLSEDLNLKDRVFILGYVSESEKAWLYKNAICYVQPSLSEGFGLPGLEAMAAGLPVISSNLTCLPEVYGDAALYFDPTNYEDMANKILEFLDNKNMSDDLRSKGYKQLKKYSWHKTATETLAAYKSVLKK
jgi:glycosyltransferase involved in cell wall biosynthesis